MPTIRRRQRRLLAEMAIEFRPKESSFI